MGWPEFIEQIESASSHTMGVEDLILPVRHLNGLPGWVAQHRLSKVGHVPQIEAAPLLLRILQADPA